MAIYQLPDGRQFDVPDSIPTDQALAGLRAKFGTEQSTIPAEQSFAQNVSNDLSQRGEQYKQIAQRALLTQQTPIQTALQTVGTTIGAGFDIGGEALKAITPDAVKDLLSKAGAKIAETAPGKFAIEKLTQGMQAFGEFEKQNPALGADVRAITNIGMFGSGGSGAPIVTQTPLRKGAEALAEKAAQQVANTRSDFIDKLVTPKQTAAVRQEQVPRTEEKGFLRKSVVIPTAKEIEIAKEVAKIPEVSKNRSFQYNYNVIQDRVSKQAEELKRMLDKSPVTFAPEEFKQEIAKVSTKLAEHPILVGDAEKTAQRLVGEFTKIIDAVPSTPSGLLEARKRFDTVAESFKPKVFDPNSENVFSTVVRELRNTTNNFIDNKVKNVAVKKSLMRQHNLLSAMENIVPKAADEANNSISRLTQNISKVIPLKSELAGIAALGGLSAAGVLQPYTVFPMIGLYGATKFALSPSAKRSLSYLIKQADRAIAQTTDVALRNQLKLDRAALLEMIESSQPEEK